MPIGGGSSIIPVRSADSGDGKRTVCAEPCPHLHHDVPFRQSTGAAGSEYACCPIPGTGVCKKGSCPRKRDPERERSYRERMEALRRNMNRYLPV